MSLCVLCRCMYVCVCTLVCVHISACIHGGQGWFQLSCSIEISCILLRRLSLNLQGGWQSTCPSDPPVSTQSPPVSAPAPVCKHTIKHSFLHGLHLSSKNLTHWANSLTPEYFIHINVLLSKRKSTSANSFWLHTTFHWRSSVRVSPAGFVPHSQDKSGLKRWREHTE